MNVAIITSEYPPYNNIGGIATFSRSLTELLIRQGHEVFVIIDTKDNKYYLKTEKNVTIIPFVKLQNVKIIKLLSSLFVFKALILLLNRYFPQLTETVRINFLVLLTFKSLLEKKSIHAVHATILFAPAFMVKLMYSYIPLISHAQGPDELLQAYDSTTIDSRLKVLTETCFMRQANFIITCSKAVHKYLADKHIDLKSKFVHIPNFIISSQFPKLTTTPNTNRLLFWGRMEFRKGPDMIVKAFARLAALYPQISLTLMGDDTDGWTLKGKPVKFTVYVDSLGIKKSIRDRISYVKRIDDRHKLIDCLSKQTGISILPSRYEPFGYVYIESMISGCITVASSNGGGAEIIQNGVDGFVVNPTVKNLIKSVMRIKSMKKADLVKMTKRAKNKIATYYDISYVANKYAELYKHIPPPPQFYR